MVPQFSQQFLQMFDIIDQRFLSNQEMITLFNISSNISISVNYPRILGRCEYHNYQQMQTIH